MVKCWQNNLSAELKCDATTEILLSVLPLSDVKCARDVVKQGEVNKFSNNEIALAQQTENETTVAPRGAKVTTQYNQIFQGKLQRSEQTL